MGRVAGQKIAPKHTAVGTGRPVTYDGGNDMQLHGYYLPAKADLQVNVPIFQHAFYPKLGHTDLDIKQNITKRLVRVPSLATLRAHGIEAEKAIFVAEVVVHPRYIKHNNYFRGDFPAVIKTIAKRDNIVLIFPASDMPSARLKRKQVLTFWRMAFSPLLIKGRQYTSGRMGMFFVAPPGATTKLKRSLNLEDVKSLDNLKEWYPGVSTTSRPRKRGPKRKYTQKQEQLARAIVNETSERMADELLPLVSSKLDIDPKSPQGKELEKLITSPETSRSLLHHTAKKHNRMLAVKTWVKSYLWPRIIEIAQDEAHAAIDTAIRFTFQIVLAVVLNAILGKVQANKLLSKLPGVSNLEYNQLSSATRTQFGSGALGYRFKLADKDKSEIQQRLSDFIMAKISHYFGMYGEDPPMAMQSLIIVQLDDRNKTRPVTIRFDSQQYAKLMKRDANQQPAYFKAGVNLGPFEKPESASAFKRAIPQFETAAKVWWEKEQAGSGNDADYMMGMF
jgi:hypothetical protein